MTTHAYDWLAKWAYYTPEKLFLREQASQRSWTYSQFNQSVNRTANYLVAELGMGKGERLAIYARNQMSYFLLYFAAVRAGIIVVPLNFRLTPAELDVLLKDAQPAVLFYDSLYREPVSQLTVLDIACQKIDMGSLAHFLEPVSKPVSLAFEDRQIGSEDLVMILYTSGTTGVPKGAMITHKMLFWNAVNTGLRLDLSSADHTQAYAPLFHTGGWNVLFTPFLHHGASHTILEGFDPALILELIEKEGSTILFAVPTMMQMMVDAPGFASADLSSLRYAVVGGAPMPIPLIEIWHEKGVPIRQGYGLTEVGPNCFSLNQDAAIRKQGSIGFPNFYMDAKIVDDLGLELGPDLPGELCLRSPVVTPGYWRRQKETAAAMTDGWFHTGDMAKRDSEGYYYIVDRKKNMFISGGENVYPAEIEAVLVSHPVIKEAAIIGIADEKWGEVGKAFIVPNGDLDVDEVRVYCAARLAKFKIPKEFTTIDQLPLNDSGKLDRKQLNKLHNQQKETLK